jgi:hypothetical protein
MTHPIDLPDTFPDARDDEYHGGGAFWLIVGLAVMAGIGWWVLA